LWNFSGIVAIQEIYQGGTSQAWMQGKKYVTVELFRLGYKQENVIVEIFIYNPTTNNGSIPI
jgi:hypothetical protein